MVSHARARVCGEAALRLGGYRADAAVGRGSRRRGRRAAAGGGRGAALRRRPNGEAELRSFRAGRGEPPSAMADPDRIVVDLSRSELPARSGGRTRGADAPRPDRQGVSLRPVRSRQVARRHRSCAARLRRESGDGGRSPRVGGLAPLHRVEALRGAAPSPPRRVRRRRAAPSAPRRRATEAAATPPPPGRPIVVLDPGHGGADGGANGAKGLFEKTIVFDSRARGQAPVGGDGQVQNRAHPGRRITTSRWKTGCASPGKPTPRC